MSNKDYTSLAKDVDKGLMELWEAMKNSPHVSQEERVKFANLVQQYSTFFNQDFVTGKEEQKDRSAKGMVPLESGNSKVIIPL